MKLNPHYMAILIERIFPREINMGKGRLSTIVCTCEKCGKQFHPWHNNRANRFCSRACAPKGRQPTRPDCICEYCKVLFRPVNNTTQKFCSRKCYRDVGMDR